MTGAWDGGRRMEEMTILLIKIDLVVLTVLILYLLWTVRKHELAISELLKLHPTLLADEEEDDE
jgi:hypothetical protein